jgi:hypothetical protein
MRALVGEDFSEVGKNKQLRIAIVVSRYLFII